jgi:hypothetical protein
MKGMTKEELLDKVTDELLAHAIFSHRGTSMNRAYAMDAAKAVIAIMESCQPADKWDAEQGKGKSMRPLTEAEHREVMNALAASGQKQYTISPGLESAIQDELDHPPASIMEEGK